MQRETPENCFLERIWVFKSTPSMQRETRGEFGRVLGAALFKSTPSMQRETEKNINDLTPYEFKSTPSMQRETV